jgi:uncharacterized caspase-like protein
MTNPTNENSDLERKLIPVVTEIEPVEQGRSLVVVIGINEYVHWQKLKNAVQDAIGFQQTLIDKLGFFTPIPPLLDSAATKSAIESLIEEQLRDVLEFAYELGCVAIQTAIHKNTTGDRKLIPVDVVGESRTIEEHLKPVLKRKRLDL